MSHAKSPNVHIHTYRVYMKLKLGRFIDQYNTLRIGFFLFDFYWMNWAFYWQTVVNCIIYFLLIVNTLK